MLEQILTGEVFPRLKKPARYLGTEWNAVKKNWNEVAVKMAFAFPDLYEVGMSHLGLHILYGLVNAQPDYLMERVFAPARDLEEELRRRGLPLFSLESHRPLADFDVIGFTLQYELTFTNFLNMLDLAGIPLLAGERTGFHPLVIGGGPVAFNPEPVAPFFDALVIGEGEEALLEVLEVVKRAKEGGFTEKREALLEKLAEVPGVYVPGFYRVEYTPEGRVSRLEPVHPKAPPRVRRRLLRDLDAAYYPAAPVVPLAEAVHERGMLEVFRGCTRGCRFCQAGMIYRPVRERTPEALLRQAGEILKNTGYEEISLVSLSTLDYSGLGDFLPLLREKCGPSRTGISLPSLRVDSFSVGVARGLPGERRKSLTFAPEAGTQRLRNVINKGVTEADFLEAVRTAFEAGWSAVKLYFMVGLPTEEQADLEGIGDLVRKTRRIAQEVFRGRKKVRLAVSASSFVPKAHTPFQWEGQLPRAALEERHRFLRSLVRKSGAVYHWHQIEMSFLEAVFARGDRRLAPVLVEAWRRGCRFDGWTENFRFPLWEESFRAVGLDPEFYAGRRIAYDETLPWDLIDSGIEKDFLVREHRRALAGLPTPDCRDDACAGCGVCFAFGVAPVLTGRTGRVEAREAGTEDRG
ncbi:MAG: TIGR03960 family B12-binding radical SAM protein [Firmicutes bacterium]|nr:TIGR03960 family B12-binding radical SAM protein [Bacillota bacterium]